MPQVLAERLWSAWTRAAALVWRPLDTLVVAYLLATGLLIAWNHSRVPASGPLLALHAAGVGLVLLLARSEATKRSGALWFWRHWYPLVYLPACYKEMALLIPAIRRTDYDAFLARLELAVWGVYPTVWLERFQQPWLTELLQFLYTLFFAAILAVAGWLWRKNRLEEFRLYAFAISLGFLVTYVGYFAVPVRGPRFLLADLHAAPLEGLWLFGPLRRGLDWLESVHYDCFPSGHVAMSLIAWWTARRLSPAWGHLYAIYTALMVFSTVYLRYHYTVDLLAGALLAVAAVVAAQQACGRPRRGS
ncbi:MAG: phosphatase PAP2 family protein [Bryobacterales bacterium]|nr:phosphatase PAP2 family protein [Bryobacteraceae bacterium]MDW8131750.1 phosphatase PAP2 family protein [Bryobacterales bacterium]